MKHEKHLWFALPASERPTPGQQPPEKKSNSQLGPGLEITKKLSKGGKMIGPHR